MPKTKRAIWLCSGLGPEEQEKGKLLRKLGLQVQFVESITALLKLLEIERIPYVLVSDDLNQAESSSVKETIAEITRSPNLRSAKFILICKIFDPQVLTHAAAHSFRGIISLSLPNENWLNQMRFVLAQGPSSFPLPHGAIWLNQLCEIQIPMRVVWLSYQRVRLESALKMKPGQSLTLTGSLANLLDHKNLKLSVTSIATTRLSYRFSQALELSWPEDINKKDIDEALIRAHHDFEPTPIRVFAVVKKRTLRQAVIEAFQPDHFDLTLALQIKSMNEEPAFLAPDLIILEEPFTTGAFEERFKKLITLNASTCKVVIIGQRPSQNSVTASNKISILWLHPDDASPNTLRTFAPQKSPDTAAHYLRRDAPLSYAFTSIRGRITQLHPRQLTLTSPVALSPYGHFRIATPLLENDRGEMPWCKLTSCWLNQDTLAGANERYISSGYFESISENDSAQLAQHMIDQMLRIIEPHLSTSQSNQEIEKPTALKHHVIPQKPTTNIKSNAPVLDRANPEPTLDIKPLAQRKRTLLQQLDRGIWGSPAKQVAVILAILIVIGAFFALIMPYVARDLQKSGKVYSDQLQIFKNSN